jgi:hypothetical protein
LLWLYQTISPSPRLSLYTVRNVIRFYGELLAPRPTPKLEDHPLSAVCVFNIFTATLCIEGRLFISNLRTCHAVVTGPLITERLCYIVNILRCPGIKRILLNRYMGRIPG